MLTVVVIEPENSANIGSIARVMANFNESRLLLINPRCVINEESRRLAKNAQGVLKAAQLGNIEDLDGFDYIVGTTSKLGRDYNIPKCPMTPDQLSGQLSKVKGRKIALVLGRESDGLRNEEVERCDFIVTIPTGKSYSSMNISHALAILLYEINKPILSEELLKPYAPISDNEKRQIMKNLDMAMEKMDFLNDLKKDTQRSVWKRMISKSFMTRREAFALIGFLKKIK